METCIFNADKSVGQCCVLHENLDVLLLVLVYKSELEDSGLIAV